MRVTLIAAVNEELAIGKMGRLPWHCPEDLAHFKALTMGKHVLCGRKTWQSIGSLPGRKALILSRHKHQSLTGDVFGTIGSAMEHAQKIGLQELWVIGGREIYEQTLPLAHAIILSRVPGVHEDCDCWFPDFEHHFRLVSSQETSWGRVEHWHNKKKF